MSFFQIIFLQNCMFILFIYQIHSNNAFVQPKDAVKKYVVLGHRWLLLVYNAVGGLH